jgi:hypothetical protein
MSDPKDRLKDHLPPINAGSGPGLVRDDAIQDRNLAVQGSPDGEDDEELNDARLTEAGVAAAEDDDLELDDDLEDDDQDDAPVATRIDEEDAETSGSTLLTDETPPRGYR